MKTIDAIENRLADTFQDRKLYSAWSSSVIRKKVATERGQYHDSAEEALAKVHADGVDDLVVVTTFLMPGREMKRVDEAVAQWEGTAQCRVSRADPLLDSDEDIRSLAEAVRDEFSQLDEDEALVLMGHGSAHGSNDVYPRMQACLREVGLPLSFVATVEGKPTFEDMLPELYASNARRACLAPLMIVAGDHANNDLAGSGDDSWKSILCSRGIQARAVLKGLGEYAGVQNLICEHARKALKHE